MRQNKMLILCVLAMLLAVPSALALLPRYEFVRDELPVAGMPIENVRGHVEVAPTRLWRQSSWEDIPDVPEEMHVQRPDLSRNAIMPGDAVLREAGTFYAKCAMPVGPLKSEFKPAFVLEWCVGRETPAYLLPSYRNDYFDRSTYEYWVPYAHSGGYGGFVGLQGFQHKAWEVRLLERPSLPLSGLQLASTER